VKELEARTWKLLARYGVHACAPLSLPSWGMATLRQAKAIWKEILKKRLRLLRGKTARRGQEEILVAYGKQWRKKTFNRYLPRDLKGEGAPWIWRRFRFTLSNEAGAAVRLLYLEHALTGLKPRKVLEVGCGNGINLHLLSSRFMRTEFTGLEATAEGCMAAQRLVDAGKLTEELRSFSPFDISADDSVGRLQIVQGSGGNLPFPDRSFDVVMTSLALEQMEELRERALSEVARVCSHYVVMLEPFRDVNGNGIRRAYVKAYDYFQGSIAELSRYGLQVIATTTDMPHKAWLGTAVVVARRVQ
jgi:ubiquinone/menaquinone biosynthesis C-methylase UbiE